MQTVKIPKRILRSDEWYHDVCEYVANKTGLEWDDSLYDGDGAYGDAYFRDSDGGIWHGVLNGPENYDGTKDYFLEEIDASRKIRYDSKEAILRILRAQCAEYEQKAYGEGMTEDLEKIIAYIEEEFDTY